MVQNVVVGLLEMVAGFFQDVINTILQYLSLDLDIFEESLPGFTTLGSIMEALGLAAVILCLVAESISLITSPFSGRNVRGGIQTFLRIIISGVLVFFILDIVKLVLVRWVEPLYDMIITNGLNYRVDVSDIERAISSSTLQYNYPTIFDYVAIIILLFQFVKITLSLVTRYITFGFAAYVSPLVCGFAASPMTDIIPRTWLKTFLAQVVLFLVTAWAVNAMYVSLQFSSGGSYILQFIFVWMFGKVILKMDDFLARCGFNCMPSMANMRSGLAGVVSLGMMAARGISRMGGNSANSSASGSTTKSTIARGDMGSTFNIAKGADGSYMNVNTNDKGFPIKSEGYSTAAKNASRGDVNSFNTAVNSVNAASKHAGAQVSAENMNSLFDPKGKGYGWEFKEGTAAISDGEGNFVAPVTYTDSAGHKTDTEKFIAFNEGSVYSQSSDGQFNLTEDRLEKIEHDGFTVSTQKYDELGAGTNAYSINRPVPKDENAAAQGAGQTGQTAQTGQQGNGGFNPATAKGTGATAQTGQTGQTARTAHTDSAGLDTAWSPRGTAQTGPHSEGSPGLGHTVNGSHAESSAGAGHMDTPAHTDFHSEGGINAAQERPAGGYTSPADHTLQAETAHAETYTQTMPQGQTYAQTPSQPYVQTSAHTDYMRLDEAVPQTGQTSGMTGGTHTAGNVPKNTQKSTPKPKGKS